MAKAADIIQALIERSPRRLLLERHTGLPWGWALWLRAQPKAPARPLPSAREIAGLLAGRPPSPPAAGERLTLWRAFLALWRQGWAPAPRDERPLRAAAWAGSIAMHLLFAVALVWVALVRALPPAPPAAGGGDERVQVGFSGRGDPSAPQAGGETAADAAGTATPAEPAPAAAPPATASAPRAAAAPARTAPEPVPAETSAPVEAEQPVQVTEVEVPTFDYVLPPTRRAPAAPEPPEVTLRPREVPLVVAPRLEVPQPRPPAVPEPRVREPELRPREVPLVVVPEVQLRPRPLDVPAPAVREPELRPREVAGPMPEPRPAAAAVPLPQLEAVPRPAPEPRLREREIPAPRPAPAPAAAPAASTDTAAQVPQTSGARPGPAQPAATAAPAAAAGEGAAAPGQAADGRWQSLLAGDDWGQARQGTPGPGGEPGLFDGQGRVRVPGEGLAGAEGGGRGPPGSAGGDEWTRERLEQAGTWLKRPPYDYQPTRFDDFWRPNESLLAEWVRKGIRTISIPIPGGNGRALTCVVSLLQLGGGCGIRDPNLNEQPAVARPPPEVPFKPELQEDNGSVPGRE